MHDLMWAFYWIDVLSSISRNFFLTLLFGVIGGCVVMFIRDHNKSAGPTGKSIALGFIPAFVVAVALNFIPSKETMYLMLGVKTTENIVNSETGQKVQKLLNEKLDEYLSVIETKKERK